MNHTEFRDLSYLVGEEVSYTTLKANQREAEYHSEPLRVVVLEDYERTILLELTYEGGKVRRMIDKPGMFCGDIQIRWGRKLLTGLEVMI